MTINIPADSVFCFVKQSGRNAVPQGSKGHFDRRFEKAAQSHHRDYRFIETYLRIAARERNYHLKGAMVTTGSTMTYQDLWIATGNINLFCDVFVAAIDSCPLSDENIYEDA